MKTIIKLGLSFFYFITLFYIFFLAGRRRGPWHKRRINLLPFKHKIEYLSTYSFISGPEGAEFYKDILGNIVLFIPFAFFLRYIFHIHSSGKIILIALLTSFFVELTQFIFSIGVADIDDVILNITGTVIGLFFLKLVFERKLAKDFNSF